MSHLEKSDASTSERLTELLRSVDGMAPFVRYRMRGRPSDVDIVLQSVREIVWRRCEAYDARRGTADSFVFGITRNVIRRELGRHLPPMEELPPDLESAHLIDPLVALVRRFDTYRWVRLVAHFVGASDWAVIAEYALSDGDKSRIIAQHQLTPSAFRAIRERVHLTAHTVRAALAVVDAGVPVTAATTVECIPERGGLREVAQLLGQDAETIAATLRIHPGSARARIATVKRLLSIAKVVLDEESAS